jgi:hypothetical protein
MSNLKTVFDFLNMYKRVEFSYGRNSEVIQSFDFFDDEEDESEHYIELSFCTDSSVRFYADRVHITFTCPFTDELYESANEDFELESIEEKCLSFASDYRTIQFSTV